MVLKPRIAPVTTPRSFQLLEPKHLPTMQTFIQTFAADLADIESFLSISFSPTRSSKVEDYLTSTLSSLTQDFDFDQLRQSEQVDYLLLKSHIKRLLHQNEASADKYHAAQDLSLFGQWVDDCIQFVETRHKVGKHGGSEIATVFQKAAGRINDLIHLIDADDSFKDAKDRFIVFWTIAKFSELHGALEEAVAFYQGYDPVISWWTQAPWETLSAKLTALDTALKRKTGIDGPSSADDIVGDPIGRGALLQELEAEWIAYTPEELVQIGEEEFKWCEREMNKASKALGFDSPKDALEHVKNTFVGPGEQIHVSAFSFTGAIDDP